MKPNIDIKSPAAKALINKLQERSRLAYSAADEVSAAVRPLFVAPPPKFIPQQIGSCVLVRLIDQLFIFSASHVFEELHGYQPLVACGNKLHSLPGDRFSTRQGKSGTHRDDPIDASVFHIQGYIDQKIQDSAITIDSLDFNPESTLSAFVALGFRSNKSKTVNGAHTSKQEVYPSIELYPELYEKLKIDPKIHIALSFEKQILVNDQWQQSPSPRGLSGGGIFRVDGLSFNPEVPISSKQKTKLSALTIEQRVERSGNPGALIGTRIGVHLGLIQQYLPEVIKKINENGSN